MVSTVTSAKGKKVKLQHLPTNRAKKLKKSWVDAKKIKTKWKVEKRKNGLMSGSNTTELGPRPQGSAATITDGSDRESENDSRRDLELPASTSNKFESNDIRGQNSVDSTKPSLREMAKQAYSRDSLHTYKAGPLKRHRGSADGGRGGNRTTSVRGGRGQPNMKLRMGVMLEQIKRSYA